MRSRESQVKELYAGSGWISFFTNVRFWTGSFAQVERHVPTSGVILDVGCGYGIFANYLALRSSERKLIGVELDKKKLNQANKHIENTRFILGDATKMKLNNLAGIVILDVLHHLNSYSEQDKLIRSCYSMLERGGRLIIAEVDQKPFWKLVLARFVDFILYPGQPVYYRYKKVLLAVLESSFGHVHAYNLKGNPFPHVVYICQKT